MKRIIIILCIAFGTITMHAEKLTIIHENWKEAQQLAKQQNKLIIIDYYTTWCGPCKMFSASLKKNDKLQDELSKNFIMLKYDAEKDKEYNLSKKFHVRAYPTFVIVTADVNYAGRLVGGALQDEESVKRFLDFTNAALQMRDDNSFRKGYNQSLTNTYPDFYTKSMNKEGKFDKDDLAAFWKNNSDYESEVSFAILSSFGGSDKANDYFLKNKDTYANNFGEVAAKGVADNMFSKKVYAAMKAKDEKMFDEAKEFAIKYTGAKESDLAYTEMRFASAVKNCERFENALATLKKNAPKSADGVNSICWMVYKSECDNPSLLNKATAWMEDLNPLQQDYAFIDTYACLLYKSKKYKEAKTYINRAIAKAKEEGEKYDASTKMLEQIEKKLK